MLDIPPDPGRRGVVGVVARDGRLLVIRRSSQVVAPGMYCFPGGGIEPGESEPEALVREFREELGVVVRPVRRLWQSVTPWQVRLTWWLADLDAEAQMTPDQREVESIHWVTPAEMAEFPDSLPSNFEFLDALAAGQIDLTPWPGQTNNNQ